MIKRFPVIGVIFLVASLILATSAYAHGVDISHIWSGEDIIITCRYDDGSALIGATVDIFAPTDPGNPWVTGQTDSNGNFLFTPDRSNPGEWGVRARLEGHGGMAYMTVEKNSPTTEQILQILLAIAAIVFAFSAIRYFRKTTSVKDN